MVHLLPWVLHVDANTEIECWLCERRLIDNLQQPYQIHNTHWARFTKNLKTNRKHALKVPYHRRGCKNSFKWNFKSQCFSNIGSISIENISFSRNCDIKTTNAKSVTDHSIWVAFISKNSVTLEIAEHSLFNSPIIIRRFGFHFRSTDLADKPYS